MNEAAAEARRDVTRRKLIEVAAQQFALGGYHGTSFSDLIAATGLSKGAFYHHFRSKQDLAIAVYEAKQTELVEQLAAVPARPLSLLDRLFEQLRKRAQAFAVDPGLMCLPRLASDFAKDPALRALVDAMHRPAIERFAELIREGQRTGEVRSDLRADAVARTTFAALVGMTELAKREGGASHQAEETEELIELLSAALRPVRSEKSKPRKKGGVS